MITSYYRGEGGVRNGPKCDYVIFEYSLMVEGYFRHAQDEKNYIKFKDREVQIEGLATKSR